MQAPTITQQPANANICAGGNASFTVGATARHADYRWQKRDQLNDVGHYSGVSTPTLTITGADEKTCPDTVASSETPAAVPRRTRACFRSRRPPRSRSTGAAGRRPG